MDTKDAGRKGGRSKSKAKQEAARRNGKKGGRRHSYYKKQFERGEDKQALK